MATTVITSLFDDYATAARAVHALESDGVPHANISIITAGNPVESDGVDKAASVTGGVALGASVGGIVGAGAGLLAGLGIIAIPGLGPVVGTGWFAAAAIGAVAGAGVAGVTGGLIGALTDIGVSASDADMYAETLRRGGTLVTVMADPDHAAAVAAILKLHERIGNPERKIESEASGWRHAEPTADATPDPTALPPREPEVANQRSL